MQDAKRTKRWVVYTMPVKDDPAGRRAVCTEQEWGALTAARPGVFALVRDGIASEGEAERLARGTSGDRPARPGRPAQVVRLDPSGTPTVRPA